MAFVSLSEHLYDLINRTRSGMVPQNMTNTVTVANKLLLQCLYSQFVL